MKLKAIFIDAGKDSIKTVCLWNQHHGRSGGWGDSGDAVGMVALVKRNSNIRAEEEKGSEIGSGHL